MLAVLTVGGGLAAVVGAAPVAASPGAFVFSATLTSSGEWMPASPICGTPCPSASTWSIVGSAVGVHEPATTPVLLGSGTASGWCGSAVRTGVLAVGDVVEPLVWIEVGGQAVIVGSGGHGIAGVAAIRPVSGDCITSPATQFVVAGTLTLGSDATPASCPAGSEPSAGDEAAPALAEIAAEPQIRDLMADPSLVDARQRLRSPSPAVAAQARDELAAAARARLDQSTIERVLAAWSRPEVQRWIDDVDAGERRSSGACVDQKSKWRIAGHAVTALFMMWGAEAAFISAVVALPATPVVAGFAIAAAVAAGAGAVVGLIVGVSGERPVRPK